MIKVWWLIVLVGNPGFSAQSMLKLPFETKQQCEAAAGSVYDQMKGRGITQDFATACVEGVR